MFLHCRLMSVKQNDIILPIWSSFCFEQPTRTAPCGRTICCYDKLIHNSANFHSICIIRIYLDYFHRALSGYTLFVFIPRVNRKLTFPSTLQIYSYGQYSVISEFCGLFCYQRIGFIVLHHWTPTSFLWV